MVTDGDDTYSGAHWVMYRVGKSSCTPEINITLFVNYTSIIIIINKAFVYTLLILSTNLWSSYLIMPASKWWFRVSLPCLLHCWPVLLYSWTCSYPPTISMPIGNSRCKLAFLNYKMLHVNYCFACLLQFFLTEGACVVSLCVFCKSRPTQEG